ncbi:TAXI family TRAP transporter solute-binding subunit [Candidatus Uabimicrobium amorphum]|uniref:TAXI family TRAP transporter solute-binding subunit n=1 Tax=Uabimicrobium amorphum TaxID=2596890 RepID=A0A5S9IHI9_UABAM|nr:TAXI family TRAP transporter solute-binding subunit [Candidatus Uabimicrobium amorphum]BBM81670.1 hypothetical protein UABAM_00009 [Candidatus Uabimicrobium amorphum]
MKQIFIFSMIALLLIGCSKGPNGQDLQKSVQQKLDNHFQNGLFKIKSFSRRGSYPYEADGSTQLLLYYKAEVEFLKDYKLSDWNNLNVTSLISVLGATPIGVTGVKQEGNKKGDVLLVYGTNNYILKDGKWLEHKKHIKKSTDSSGKTKVFVSELEEDEKLEQRDLPQHEQHISEIKKLAKDFRKKKEPQNLAFLNSELKKLIRQAKFQAGKARGWTTIATGSTGGEYYALGNGLQQLLSTKKHVAKIYNTSGSQENCKLVENSQVQFAFSQNDIAAMAYNSSGLFQNAAANKNLRAVCSLYPEALHIASNKKVSDLTQLVGKKLNIGAPGSGERANALQLISAYQLKLEQFTVSEYGFQEAVAALRKGEIDALITTRAYPAQLLQNIANSTDLHLVSIKEEVRNTLTKQHAFISINIPGNTYIGLNEAVKTVGVTAMIITHKDTANERVQKFLETLFKGVGTLTKASSQANYISPEHAKIGVSIPLHDAAKSYFSSN